MADIEIEVREDILVAFLKGDIDHHCVQRLRLRIDSEIIYHSPRITVLDFSMVGFMDSSGVGLILGRNKLVSTLGKRLAVQGVPENLTKILKLAGISYTVANKAQTEKEERANK
ncbi:MAG: anti-sigma factor antagonist [Oscillospiraceae bacterium]